MEFQHRLFLGIFVEITYKDKFKAATSEKYTTVQNII